MMLSRNVRGTLEFESANILFTSKLGAVIIKNMNPIVPGHIVVLPKRPVNVLRELQNAEVADLFQTVQTAQNISTERNTSITAFNFSIQDGRVNQPLPQTLIHIVPRCPDDLPPDKVHQLIEQWRPETTEIIPTANMPPLELIRDNMRHPRTNEEMMMEAGAYVNEINLLKSSALTAEVSTQLHQENITENDELSSIYFSKFKIDPKQIFYVSRSKLSIGIVNLKPLVPGHVLVIPRRVIARYQELTQDEIEDLWLSVLEIQKVILSYHGSEENGSQIGLQDGCDAGQSVPHVHVHILPAMSRRV